MRKLLVLIFLLCFFSGYSQLDILKRQITAFQWVKTDTLKTKSATKRIITDTLKVPEILFVDGSKLTTATGTMTIAPHSATYTLVLTDAGKVITMTGASADTLHIPANGSVPFPIGTCVLIIQTGAGQVTVTITSDTLLSADSKKRLRVQGSTATLIKTGSTTWVLMGDLN